MNVFGTQTCLSNIISSPDLCWVPILKSWDGEPENYSSGAIYQTIPFVSYCRNLITQVFWISAFSNVTTFWSSYLPLPLFLFYLCCWDISIYLHKIHCFCLNLKIVIFFQWNFCHYSMSNLKKKMDQKIKITV